MELLFGILRGYILLAGTAEGGSYIAQFSVNLATAPETYSQRSGIQIWFALYYSGYDA
jgi:hypothetical protein